MGNRHGPTAANRHVKGPRMAAHGTEGFALGFRGDDFDHGDFSTFRTSQHAFSPSVRVQIALDAIPKSDRKARRQTPSACHCASHLTSLSYLEINDASR